MTRNARNDETIAAWGLKRESYEEYASHSRSGECMSSHLLADFRRSPLLYHKKICGIVPEVDSVAFRTGRAAHCLILEGDESFRSAYQIADGPINPRTGEPYGRQTKAYAEWAECQAKPAIGTKDHSFLQTLKNSVYAHREAMRLLEDGVAECVSRADYCGVPCQIRLDWFNPGEGIVDLKTCDSLQFFESDCRRYGYIGQMAFYRSVFFRTTGRLFPVYLIAVEKNEPYSTGVWRIHPDALARAEQENADTLAFYDACRSANVWPSGYEQIRTLGIPWQET